MRIAPNPPSPFYFGGCWSQRLVLQMRGTAEVLCVKTGVRTLKKPWQQECYTTAKFRRMCDGTKTADPFKTKHPKACSRAQLPVLTIVQILILATYAPCNQSASGLFLAAVQKSRNQKWHIVHPCNPTLTCIVCRSTAVEINRIAQTSQDSFKQQHSFKHQ